MSKFHGAKAGYEAGKQFYGAVKGAVKKAFSKKSPTITKTKPKVGSLTERRKNQDDVVQSAQKIINKKNLTPEGKIAVRKTIAPGMKKISKTQDEIDKLRKKKMGGGMMGRRMGYRLGMSVQKKLGMSVKGDDKRDIRKVEQMIGASKSSKREKGLMGKKFGAGDGVITPYEKRRGQAIQASIRAAKEKPKKLTPKSLPTPKDQKRPGGKS